MTEYLDLYTSDRRPLGRKIPRGAAIPHGAYHIVVQIMTVNSKGEILLTQRVPEKTNGGKWECSGGCAVSGETGRQAAVRELFEETGIRAYPAEIILEWTLTIDNMIRDFYIVRKNVELASLILQPAEVCAAKWVSFERLKDMSASGQTTGAIDKWLGAREAELRRKLAALSTV